MPKYAYFEPIYNSRGIQYDQRRVILTEDDIIRIHWPEWSHQQYRKNGFHTILYDQDGINDFIQKNKAIPIHD